MILAGRTAAGERLPHPFSAVRAGPILTARSGHARGFSDGQPDRGCDGGKGPDAMEARPPDSVQVADYGAMLRRRWWVLALGAVVGPAARRRGAGAQHEDVHVDRRGAGVPDRRGQRQRGRRPHRRGDQPRHRGPAAQVGGRGHPGQGPAQGAGRAPRPGRQRRGGRAAQHLRAQHLLQRAHPGGRPAQRPGVRPGLPGQPGRGRDRQAEDRPGRAAGPDRRGDQAPAGGDRAEGRAPADLAGLGRGGRPGEDPGRPDHPAQQRPQPDRGRATRRRCSPVG